MFLYQGQYFTEFSELLIYIQVANADIGNMNADNNDYTGDE